MEEKAVKTMAEKAMWDHGLIQKGWTFKWSRAKHDFGYCYHSRKQINLSKPLCLINEETAIMDTILHEIAHALVGNSHGHDRVWRAKAIEIGCNGVRTFREGDSVGSKTIKRTTLEKVKIYGKIYSSGDTISLRTLNGIQECTFVEYMPNNHKYPIIATLPNSNKRYKWSKQHIHSTN